MCKTCLISFRSYINKLTNKMPLISKEEIIENLANFENDLANLKKNLDDPLVCDEQNRFNKSYNKIYACQKKIERWSLYLKVVEETGRDYPYRFSGVSLSSAKSREFGRLGGRPAIYSKEVAEQRIIDKRKMYNKKYYEQSLLKKNSMINN